MEQQLLSNEGGADFRPLFNELSISNLSDFDLPIEPKAGDELYMEKFERQLQSRFSTSSRTVQAGVDGLEQDHLGSLVTREHAGTESMFLRRC